MKVKYIIILSFISIILTARDLETLDGKKYKGITILGNNLSHLEIMHNSGITKIPFSNLSKKYQKEFNYSKEKAEEFLKKKVDELKEKELEELEKKKIEEINKKKADEFEKKKAIEEMEKSLKEKTRKKEILIDNLKKIYANQITLLKKIYLTPRSNSDMKTAILLIKIYEQLLSISPENYFDKKYNGLILQSQNIMKQKDIIAYKYNEILKEDIEVAVEFNISYNSDDFYFKIGDGAFSTVVFLNKSQLLELKQSIIKIQEWKSKCRKDKMNVRKKVGDFGKMSIEFVSDYNGEFIYILLTAKGAILKQTVGINTLNISAIYWHIMNAPKLYSEKEKLINNANKLK